MTLLELRRDARVSHSNRLIRVAAWIIIGLALATSDALAQESRWRLRAGGGVLFGAESADPNSGPPQGELRTPSLTISVDVIRMIESRAELVIGATLPFVGVNLAGKDAGNLSPTGVQLGMNYRFPHTWGEIYTGPFLAGFSRDRSATVSTGTGAPTSFTFPSVWGVGAVVGYRNNLGSTEDCLRGCHARFAYDLSVRWQQARLLVDDGRISWNPVVLTASIVTRFQ
jgi:hypothetical protein